jgi:hypothetical protein
MDAKEQQEVYDGLLDRERFAVDRAMKIAERGDYKEATASFVSDIYKAGRLLGPMTHGTLGIYSGSLDKYREGLLGFFK